MKFTILGSGSSGNAVLISSENTKVLIDVGLSAREVVRRLAVVGGLCRGRCRHGGADGERAEEHGGADAPAT